jgi:HEXXH motif-containing protein
VAALTALPDAALDHLLTEPEVTSWLAGLDGGARWDGVFHLPALSRSVVVAAAMSGVECGPLDVACDGSTLTFRALGLDLTGGVPGDGDAVAWSDAGEVHVRRGSLTWAIRPRSGRWDTDGPATRLPATVGGAVVKGQPDAWLRASFPEGTEVSADPEVAVRIGAGIDEGTGLLADSWPEMLAEIRSLLRWVVPMASGDSFFVPAFRGLVAVPPGRPLALGFHVVHELSHNIMSCLYDLVDVIRNPDDRVRSPFSRELEPLASVIHSCWAFSHELRAIGRLRAANHLDDGTDWDRLITKIKVFYDKGLPLIRKEGKLTPYGTALLDAVEAQVYQEMS